MTDKEIDVRNTCENNDPAMTVGRPRGSIYLLLSTCM